LSDAHEYVVVTHSSSYQCQTVSYKLPSCYKYILTAGSRCDPDYLLGYLLWEIIASVFMLTFSVYVQDNFKSSSLISINLAF